MNLSPMKFIMKKILLAEIFFIFLCLDLRMVG